MLKRIWKIFYVTLGFVLILALMPVLILGYLYVTADMKKPVGMQPRSGVEVVVSDSMRVFADDTLRHNRPGLWEVKLCGTPFERGEGYGKLTQDLIYHQEKTFIEQLRRIVPSERYLNFLRQLTLIFNHSLGKYVNEEYRQEIYGVSLSCSNDFNFVSEPYERQMNFHSAHDIGHAMQDYMLVGCSSFAAWDTSSIGGDLIVGRNFDFYVGDEFARDKIVAFYFPANGYRFASVSWAGMMGVMSGMNEKGLIVTINAAKSTIPTASATPISLLAREILQYASTINEAVQIANRRQTFVSESLLIASVTDGRAAIIEKSPDRMGIVDADTTFIISTNHYQSGVFKNDKRNLENIRNSDSRRRYMRIEELMNRSFPLDEQKAVAILRDYKGLNDSVLGMTNEMAINQFIGHHSVVFNASKLQMWVSTSPWQAGPYVAYNLADIFSGKISFANAVNDVEKEFGADKNVSDKMIADLVHFRQLNHELRDSFKLGGTIDSLKLLDFELINPDFFGTHEFLGDYYMSVGDSLQAYNEWQTALQKVIPRLPERERIEAKAAELGKCWGLD
ncbi:MAG: choloylglycine hydrolase [Salinivirgaceae bacterium]|nr:choloylglycine hydrolase [Salinivirgaceae bacterium]